MSAVVEPATGLEFFDLSHPWGHFSPIRPGLEDVRIERVAYHAKHGSMTQRIATTMHVATHVNAPLHLIAGGTAVGRLGLDRFFGNGVVVSIPKTKWQIVSAADLAAARPAISEGDIVVIVTGWHLHYSDSQAYFGHAPGLDRSAADWLIARKVRLVAMDTPSIDHPLATSLGPHRNGPQIKTLAADYQAATGRKASADFPDWNPAHRALLRAGIPTVEQVGGDAAEIAGSRCALHAMPWRWTEGDACVIRLVAMRDPAGRYRLEA